MIDENMLVMKATFKYHEIDPCILKLNDLKQLYKLLDKKVKEAADIEIQELKNLPQYKNSKLSNDDEIKIKELFKVAVSIIGTEGEQIIGYSDSIFSDDNFPYDIRSCNFDSSLTFKMIYKNAPKNYLIINLDFKKPKIIDIFNPSFQFEKNESLITVAGTKETWVNGVYQIILIFFKSKKKKRKLINSDHFYQIYSLLFVIPISLWSIFRIDKYIRAFEVNISTILLVSIYIYIFIILTLIFRIIYNYGKWILPFVEFEPKSGSKIKRHRVFLLTILFGLIIAVIWDVIKFFL